MTTPDGKVTYQELWQQQTDKLKLFQTTHGSHGMALFTTAGILILLDHTGKEVWRLQLGTDIRTISLSDTQEILAVNDTGYSIFINAKGEVVWRKRMFHALSGVIAPTGDFLAFITKEPTVTFTDRNLRVKWAYRNLTKVPNALALAAKGATVSFSCTDERGEGIGTVAQNGKPYDAFMGLDPLLDLTVSESGNLVVGIDKNKGIYCLNCVKSFGVWKGKLSADFHGVAFAESADRTLIWSREGLLSLLDDKGNPVWEHRFPFPLLGAGISADAQEVWYASPEGRVGCLVSRVGRDLSRLEFVDVAPPPPAPAALPNVFRKIWQIELPKPAPGDSPKIRRWIDQDGTEYLLLWNGLDRLICWNDTGEEVWKTRLAGGGLRDMSISLPADLVMLATAQGVLGFQLDGSEACRFFGNFLQVHVLRSGAFALLDERGVARFYFNPDHFSHVIAPPERALAMAGTDDTIFLIGKESVTLIGKTGQIESTRPIPGALSFFGLHPDGNELLIGTAKGDLLVWTDEAKDLIQNSIGAPVGTLCYQKMEDTLFAGLLGSSEVLVLQNRTNHRSRTQLSGTLRLSCCHPRGAVFCTSVDELALLGIQGEILARYTFPDRVLTILPSRQPECVYILSEGFLGKFSTADKSSGPSQVQFVEI